MKKIAFFLCLLLAFTPMAALAEEITEEIVQAEAPEELREERQAAALPEVLSATADKSTAEPGEAVQFTVKTPAYAKFLALFSENGTKCKVWSKTGNSTDDGETRTWTVSYSFKSKGEREITFRTSTTKTYGPDSEKVRISIRQYVGPMTIEVRFKDIQTYLSTGTNGFDLYTSPNVKYVHIFAENGVKLNASVEQHLDYDTYDTWVLAYNIKNCGKRTLTFKASIDGKTYGAEDTLETIVEPPVYSVTSDKKEVHVGDKVAFTVVTHKTAKYLSASLSWHCNFLKWDAATYSTVVNGKRVWNVEGIMKYETKKSLLFEASSSRPKCYLGSYGGCRCLVKVLPATE